MAILKVILEKSPWLEVFIRRIYYFVKERGLFNGDKNATKSNIRVKADFSLLKNYLLSLGIKKGDILIVHSSYDELKSFDVNPVVIISFLRGLVGDEGTLV
ncbi:AAC(3) family N-acetyltransferase, partial [Shewanella sp. MBTL60-007]|uniref:AAC(3) family N-acetyltransferase n=1 Tax=Shewanella sp. MBTL60-007 TaxID=2815911 RepID=UPI001C8018DD